MVGGLFYVVAFLCVCEVALEYLNKINKTKKNLNIKQKKENSGLKLDTIERKSDVGRVGV